MIIEEEIVKSIAKDDSHSTPTTPCPEGLAAFPGTPAPIAADSPISFRTPVKTAVNPRALGIDAKEDFKRVFKATNPSETFHRVRTVRTYAKPILAN